MSLLLRPGLPVWVRRRLWLLPRWANPDRHRHFQPVSQLVPLGQCLRNKWIIVTLDERGAVELPHSTFRSLRPFQNAGQSRHAICLRTATAQWPCKVETRGKAQAPVPQSTPNRSIRADIGT
jgi:hypothetical protein